MFSRRGVLLELKTRQRLDAGCVDVVIVVAEVDRADLVPLLVGQLLSSSMSEESLSSVPMAVEATST